MAVLRKIPRRPPTFNQAPFAIEQLTQSAKIFIWVFEIQLRKSSKTRHAHLTFAILNPSYQRLLAVPIESQDRSTVVFAREKVGASKIITFHSRVIMAEEFAGHGPRGMADLLDGYDVRHVNGSQTRVGKGAG
jgi:hypothetical protein